MLTFLSVTNLAVLRQAEIELGPGLTVVTGETGAGKSMLLQAITLLLGSRAGRDLVRTGESAFTVQGVWAVPEHVRRELPARGDEEPWPEEIVLRRALRCADASRSDRFFLDDRVLPAGLVQELAQRLVSLSSQHEYTSLLARREQLRILDLFGAHQTLCARMQEAWTRTAELRQRLRTLQDETHSRQQRVAELRAAVDELARAAVRPGEEQELTAQIERLSHAVEIQAALGRAVATLYEEERDILSALAAVRRDLQSIATFEPECGSLAGRLDAAGAELDDVVRSLRSLLARTDVDPELLDRQQARLAQIQKLTRRYEVTAGDDLPPRLDRLAAELARLDDSDQAVARTAQELAAWEARAQEAAAALHERRDKAARRLEKRATGYLEMLEMKKARFVVQIESSPDGLGPTGADRVELLLSANPGEAPRPLQKVASGGELSRVLLALKAVLADSYPVPTYVFDEIDAGIGGKTAFSVGKLLAGLARSHQVLCITHTAQIAAFADRHILVTKQTAAGKTAATVRELASRRERIEEIARMLSGLEDSATALRHAAELLDVAGKQKE